MSSLEVTASEPRAAAVAGGGGLALGQPLGHFRIEAPLGAGGRGEVYLATDLALDRQVAIKVLPGEVTRDPIRRAQLIREARAQAQVVHPNVGHIYFIGEEVGRLYFAMEYVQGRTLAAWIAEGPLGLDEALGVVRAAALGLRAAQRLGFTHRDVKPSNLMVDRHGVVKVLDFGLVAGGEPTAPDAPTAQTSLAGTPLYMAPEQARGDAIDGRADIYALGATLYHMVSGRPPFQAETADQLRALHAGAARPSVPRAGHARARLVTVEALCRRMMAPEPDDRFASYDELLDAIEIASAQHTRPAGFWARGIAAALDFVLVAGLASFPTKLAELVSGAALADKSAVIFPLLALYHAFAVARWGTTAGKALLELEVIALPTQARPSGRRAAVRALAMMALPLIGVVVAEVLRALGLDEAVERVDSAAALSCGLLVVALLAAALRVPGKRTPWDRAAGTLVRYRGARPITGR